MKPEELTLNVSSAFFLCPLCKFVSSIQPDRTSFEKQIKKQVQGGLQPVLLIQREKWKRTKELNMLG